MRLVKVCVSVNAMAELLVYEKRNHGEREVDDAEAIALMAEHPALELLV
jgi:hypothetical protein